MITMASLCHPTSIPTTNSTTINPPHNNLLLSHLSPRNLRRSFRHLTPKLSIRNNQQSTTNTNNDPLFDPTKVDRRNILIGSGLAGIYSGATTLGSGGSALAAPPLPNVKTCNLTSTSGGGPEGLECCPPSFRNIIDFNPQNYAGPALRVRRPAHEAAYDREYVAKFEEAIRRMKALPRSDPRNFIQQANIHCAYCDGSYRQDKHNDVDYTVHFSWLFFPFHRVYLYFFERILGKLINDPTFALPYWNWDHPDGMRMPMIYTNPDSPLYDELRDPAHLPPRVADLNYNDVDTDISPELQIEYNLRVMKFQMTRNTKPELFMGAPVYPGQASEEKGTGALEEVPHNLVHVWVGDRNDDPFHRNMGSFFSAGRDPLFYGHHANVDRMWYIWNTKLNNENFTTRDWLDTYFVFYDENKQAVRIRTSDCLDVEKQLGYTYADQDLPWLDSSIGQGAPRPTKPPPSEVTEFQPVVLDKVFRIRVARPKASRSDKEKEVATEVLKVSVSVDKEDNYIKFDVFINDGQDFEAGGQTDVGRSYAGSFTSVPHKTRKGAKMDMNRRISLPLTDILDDLGADLDDYIDVAIVPKAGLGNVTITNVKIDYII